MTKKSKLKKKLIEEKVKLSHEVLEQAHKKVSLFSPSTSLSEAGCASSY
jgi:hypothetical protein